MEMGMMAQKFHNKVNFLLTVAHGEQRCSHASTLKVSGSEPSMYEEKKGLGGVGRGGWGCEFLILDMLSFEVVYLDLEQIDFQDANHNFLNKHGQLVATYE